METLTKITKDSYNSIKRNAKTSTVLSAINGTASGPIEVLILGMDPSVSALTRVITWGSNYFLFPLSKFTRDYIRRKRNINPQENKKYLSDVIVPATISLICKPLTYLIAGETDFKKIAIPTITTTLATVVIHFSGFHKQTKHETHGKDSKLTTKIKNQLNKISFIDEFNKQNYGSQAKTLAGISILSLSLFYNQYLPSTPNINLENSIQQETIHYNSFPQNSREKFYNIKN